MKHLRLIRVLVLCLVLTCLSTSALAASKAATTKPTVKVTAPKNAVRGGMSGEITVTPSVPGFLTLKLLSEDGAELNTICENQEVHTKVNTIEFDACDAEGAILPKGSYQLSAVLVNQYGLESKSATAVLKVGVSRPTLENIVVSASSAFAPVVSYDAFFDAEAKNSESAVIELSIYRTQPRPAYVDDFASRDIPAPQSVTSKPVDLTDGNALPSAAGYYTVKGTIREYATDISSQTMEASFIVDLDGSVYMLDSAPAEVIASVDEFVTAIENNTYEAPVTEEPAEEEPVAEESAAEEPVTEEPAEEEPAADAPAAEETAAEEPAAEEPAAEEQPAASAESTQKTVVSSSDDIAYAAGVCTVGAEGYQIGAGVSDSAAQSEASYWTLASDASDEAIWQAIIRPMISVDVDERESAYIYDTPEKNRKPIGTVSGQTQGLNIIKERDDGWSLVEAFRNEDGAFVRGYVRSNRLRVTEPNTTYGIVIDKSTQKLTVWKDGAPVGSCSVTTGLPTAKYLHRETPAGEYVLSTRRGTIEYYGNGFSKYTIRLSGNYHLCEIPTTKKNGSDFSLLENALGAKATRGHVCVAHDASSDGAINAAWIWEMTDTNKRVKVLILDDKDRSLVPVGE